MTHLAQHWQVGVTIGPTISRPSISRRFTHIVIGHMGMLAGARSSSGAAEGAGVGLARAVRAKAMRTGTKRMLAVGSKMCWEGQVIASRLALNKGGKRELCILVWCDY